MDAALDHEPIEVTVGSRRFQVCDRIEIGAISTIYRCRFQSARSDVEGVFKIARDPRVNDLIENEARFLRRLHAAADAERFNAFLPAIEESFRFGEGASARRQANILRMHPEIRSPDELYSLAEIKAQYPGGLDPRDVAWVWRRLLSVIGHVHAHDIVHTQVLPMHVLVEPRDHKLVLIDWCCAQSLVEKRAPTIISGGYRPWYNRAGGATESATRGLDIDFAARCMIDLMGGDPITETFPANLDPALQRYFQRCLAATSPASTDAFRLLADFDHLIETLWGPRKYRPLELAPKSRK